MRHVITGILEGSAAQKRGLFVGDVLLEINSEEVLDEIDYQALGAQAQVYLTIERNGTVLTVALEKEDWEPIGLRFGDSMILKPRTCRNQCVFCFIDQMPPKLRSTLYVKDDDWRFSLMMGNYITLTNVSDAEFERILKRKASPLYVSVHTTDPVLRRGMMNNRFAGDILERLRRLKDAGIRFHSQIVCCPGINDGDALLKTLNDLCGLWPAAQSIAVVPVGLTKFRETLPKLMPFTARSAEALLKQIAPFQKRCREQLGTTFAFASDEFYCLSGEPLPPAEWYEEYPQIENGVGLLRRFEEQMHEAAQDDGGQAPADPKSLIVATGVSAAPYIRRFCDIYAPNNVTVRVETIVNRFFGETVTVAGLLTGGDVLAQLSPAQFKDADKLLISASMLRHDRDLFLDGMTFEEFENSLPLPVRIVDDGYDFYNALRNR
jgi:putative radical SAM enzyme (TIGR03279 family)